MNYQYEEIKCLQFLDVYMKKSKLKSKITEVKKKLLKLIFWSLIFIFHMIKVLNLNKLILCGLILGIVVIIRIFLGISTSKIKKETNNISFLNNERKIILENIKDFRELTLIKNLIISNKNNREGDYLFPIICSIIFFFIGFNTDFKIYELLIKNIMELLILLSALIIFIPILKYLFNNNKNEIKQLLIKNINLIEYERSKEQ